MSRAIDLVGKKVGTWTIVRRNGSASARQPLWLCRCDCGRESVLWGEKIRKGYAPVCNCEVNAVETKEWKNIPGYEGHYQVSINGQVKSMRRTTIGASGVTQTMKEKNLALTASSHGYLGCVLCRGGKTKSVLVHHLVALVFIGPRPDNHVIHHIDRNRHNNAAWNLKYKLDIDHASDHGRGRAGKRKLTDEQVLQVFELAHKGEKTQEDIGKMFGIGFRMVSAIKNGTKRSELLAPLMTKGE